jgi:Na+/H+-translocating membrane pyrophosphatase
MTDYFYVVKIPFISMVVLLIKLALASIPAAILVGAIWSLIIGAIGNNFEHQSNHVVR